MDTKKVNDLLDRLTALLGEGEVSDIERDSALEMLREIYSEVKFGNVQTSRDDVPEEQPAQISETPEQPDAEIPAEISVPAHEVVEQADAVASEQTFAETPEHTDAEAPKEEPVAPQPQSLSNDEPLTARQVEERHVIFSLYGDGQQKVGDVINADAHTLADTLSKREPEDVASVIAPYSTLREAIGINDRLLVIRDLFGGDPTQYDDAISQLEAFDNLDDALIHIEATYRWNPASAGARLLMELLKRKLN